MPTDVGSAQVAILGDDLIWTSRLADAVTAAGGAPRRTRRLPDFEATLAAAPELAIVDLTALAYDGVEAIRVAAAAGVPVLAVGQHDDVDLRKRALAAGATRVLAYRKLFEDGPAVVRALLAEPRALLAEPRALPAEPRGLPAEPRGLQAEPR